MDNRYRVLIICTVILCLCFVGTTSAKTWYVDANGGADFTVIQDAITAANASDTIIVRDGTYTENIDVNKRLTINTWHIQEDIVRGVRMHVLEALTPSLQTVENTTNASYYIVIENLGNLPDTFDLVISSVDNPEILSLGKHNVFLDAGEISTGTKSTVKDVIETWTIVQGLVGPAPINSTITNSALINSSIDNSIINISAIINSIISGSVIIDSIINNSEVVGTSLSDVILGDAIVNKGGILSGNITINGITYEINNETRISDLVIGTDYSDSNLVGIKNKTLKVYAANSNVSFDIGAENDYFAEAMSVQKSTIPPNGIPEFRHNVGGYVYVNVSDNLANSTGRLIIKVFYDQNKLDNLDEESLRLRYFNETADPPGWEDVPTSGIDLIENYVWGNISHFSVFALHAQPSVSAPSGPNVSLSTRGGGVGVTRQHPEEIAIPIANPGTNIFNFEWLGLDITKVSINLKSMTINAKVALKKVDKPAEIPDPPGIVYGYFDISTNIEPEKIHASRIHFRILKSWTVFNDVNVETIKLCVYANGWEELETAKIEDDDDNYFYFSADAKGFSLIAITSEKRAVDVTPTAPTAPTPTPPSQSPVPALSPPVHLAPVSLTGRLIIIVTIVASAIIVSVTYLVLKRRKA